MPLPAPQPRPPAPVAQTFAARMTAYGTDDGGPWIEVTVYGQIPRTQTGTAPVLDASGNPAGQTVPVYAEAQEWPVHVFTGRPTSSDYAAAAGQTGAAFANAVAAAMIARLVPAGVATAAVVQQVAALSAVVQQFQQQSWSVTPGTGHILAANPAALPADTAFDRFRSADHAAAYAAQHDALAAESPQRNAPAEGRGEEHA